MDSVAASEAVDPGSTPGTRTTCCLRVPAIRCRSLRFLAKMFQEVLFEQMVDQAAFLGEHAFDNFARQVTIYDAIGANTQTMVSSEFLPQGQAIASFFFEPTQSEPDSSP